MQFKTNILRMLSSSINTSFCVAKSQLFSELVHDEIAFNGIYTNGLHQLFTLIL